MEVQSTPPPARRGRFTRIHAALLVLVIAVVGLDRLTKEIVANAIDRGDAWPSDDWPVRLVHVINTGAAFGMLQDTGPLLAILGVVGVAVIVAYLLAPGLVSAEFVDWRVQVGLTLMLGGALGNLLDRLAGQGVVDFVKFPNFPAFNVADSAITIGVLALLWGFLRSTEESPPEPASSDASSRSELDGSTR